MKSQTKPSIVTSRGDTKSCLWKRWQLWCNNEATSTITFYSVADDVDANAVYMLNHEYIKMRHM